MSDHPYYLLGKKPAEKDARTLQWNSIIKAKVAVPDEYDFDTTHRPIAPLPMYANDRYGCCVISGRAHQTLRFEILEQKQVIAISDREVVSQYLKETGGRDSGLVVLYSLRSWRRGWRAGGRIYTIQAFANVNPLDHNAVKEAVYLDAGVGIGLSLPASASKQINQGQIWDVSRIGGRPGSWGGHYVYIVGYNKTGPVCVTWGRKQAMTWAFWDKYCDECYAIIDAVDSKSAKLRKALDKKTVISYLLDLEGKPIKKKQVKKKAKAAKKKTKK